MTVIRNLSIYALMSKCVHNLLISSTKWHEKHNFQIIWPHLGLRKQLFILQRISPKNTKGNIEILVFGLYSKICSWRMILNILDHFVWSICFFWYLYCHSSWHFMSYGIGQKRHKMAFYDILWHFLTYAIWHKVSWTIAIVHWTMAIWVSKEANWSDKGISEV